MDEANIGQVETKQLRRRGSHASRHAERTRVVNEYRASALTQGEFAAKAGIKIGTLRAWLYREAAAGRGEAGGFAPVRIVGDRSRPTTKSRGAVTVRWPQGIEVEIVVDLDGAGVERLVRELLSPCLR